MAGYGSMAMGALLLLCCLAWTSATDHTVGDSAGWAKGVDYSTWTSGKTFAVGDTLVFNYDSGAHTVNEVTQSEYSACSTSNFISTDSNSPTKITLKTTGIHYFVCGIPGHCSSGMKLSVSVGSSATSSPGTPTSPSTPPATTKPSASIRTLAPASVTVLLSVVVLLKLALF